MRSDLLRGLLVAGTLVAGTLVAGFAPAEAYPLSAQNKSGLKQDFARSRYTTAEKVEELRVHNLERVRGAVGFTLGRHKLRSGKSVHAGVVFYYKCGKKHCISSVELGAADRVRALRLVDLAAKETRIAPGSGPWFTDRRGSTREPPSQARWPVLVLQTEWTYGERRQQEVVLISLKNLRRPKQLLRLKTLSRSLGKVRRRGRTHSPFKGNRVTSMRLVKEPGKPPRLLVMESRISTRFNRCRAPKPRPSVYELQKGHFVMQHSKTRPGLGGCP